MENQAQINLAAQDLELPQFENPRSTIRRQDSLQNQQVWQPSSVNPIVGIDSTAFLINQHKEITRRSLKERALVIKTKKKYKDDHEEILIAKD